MNYKDLKGKVFWNLVVIKRDWQRPSRAYSYWICQCDCGRRVSYRSDQLRNGLSTCCPTCAEKYNEQLRIARWEEKSIVQIEKAKRMRSTVKIIKVAVSNSSAVYVKGTMYTKENIVQMRKEFQMSFKEIASILQCKKKEARTEYLKRTGKTTIQTHTHQPDHNQTARNPQRVQNGSPLQNYRNLF